MKHIRCFFKYLSLPYPVEFWLPIFAINGKRLEMNIRLGKILFAALALSILTVRLVPVAAASDKEIDCLKCHAKLKSEKVVHPALDMGCPACHTGIDARTVPHKKTNKIARGLSAAQPGLCYGCHDKAMFSKKNVHPAVGKGCTSCHNPHSSKNAKLLVAEAPDLCFSCHDKAMFSKKNIHAPVAGGMCLSCHTPHSSDQMALLLKAPLEVCLECHPDVPKKPHAISGFSAASHPVGLPKIVIKMVKNEKAEKEVAGKEAAEIEVKEEQILMDPSRPDKVLYCGSCHDPHSTSSPRLFRFNATSTMGLCSNCHKM
jgi:predicted CXXCH cytochrome family protein